MTVIDNIIRPGSRWVERNRVQIIRIIIVLCVLLGGVFVVPQAALGRRSYTIIIFLVLGGISLIPLLRWPVIGLFMTLLGAFFIPFSGPSEINISEVGIAVLLGIWLLDLIVVKRKIQIVSSRTIRPLVVIIIVSIISFGVGQLNWFNTVNHAPFDAQAGGLSIFLLSFGAFILVPHLIQDLIWLERFTWTFIIFGGLYVFGRLIGAPVDRIFQTGMISGSLFWTWLLTLAFGQALLNAQLKPTIRASLFFLSLALIYVAYAYNFDWKSGWMPALAGMSVILILKYRRFAWILTPLVLLPVFYYLSSEAIATDQYSWGTRLDAWLIVLELAKASPILGLGFGNYHFYTPLFSIRGFLVQFNSHSQYVDLIAQVGILGLLCFLWLFFEIGRLAWWLKDKVPQGFAQAYVYSAIGGIVGTLIAGFLVDWILPFVYNIGMAGFRASMLAWLFLGGLVSLEQITKRQYLLGSDAKQ